MRLAVLLCIAPIVSFSCLANATTRCCAHRGDNKNAPENTLPAFVLAVEKGAAQIELDVQRTKDGHLILMHDDKVDRTTNGTGKVCDLTFEEIRALDAGAWFSPEFAGAQVPTFAEALAVIPHSILCNVHLKGDPALGAQVAHALKALGRLAHCFLACTLEQAATARKAVPEILICNMSRQGGDRTAYMESTIASGAQFIQLSWRAGTEGLAEQVRHLHAHNITVNWFGASEEAPIRELVNANIDYILTDDLDLCQQIVQEYGVSSLAADGISAAEKGSR